MKASIILTTRNRAPDLRLTLQALRTVQRPDGLEVEVLLIDNGSTDDTPQITRDFQWAGVRTRALCEPWPGQARARNLGLNQSSGEFILFIDDDVWPHRDWLTRMCDRLRREQPCAVAGGVVLAPELLRPWMGRQHRSWLAASEWIDPREPAGMVGANMAFSRSVLERVPRFDPELGPGALGFSDDQLFAWQMLEAGYRIHAELDACVEHHFVPRRLLRQSWLDAAIRRGKSHAYCGHHWMHWTSQMVRPRLLRALLDLASWKLRHLGATLPAEGCTEEEIQLRYRCAMFRSHLALIHQPRKYERRGLVKRSKSPPGQPGLAGDPKPACAM